MKFGIGEGNEIQIRCLRNVFSISDIGKKELKDIMELVKGSVGNREFVEVLVSVDFIYRRQIGWVYGE